MSKYLQESYDSALKEIEQLKIKLARYEKALKNIVDEADLHNSEVWERMKEMERIAKETLKGDTP